MSLANSGPLGEKSLATQIAISLACTELGIGATESTKRETVAVLMAPLVKRGPASINSLKTFAVSQYRMLT